MIIMLNLIHCHLIEFTLTFVFTPSPGLYHRTPIQILQVAVPGLFTIMFCHRAINQWNSLPQQIINTTNTNTFKQHFDTYNSNVFIISYMLTVFYKYKPGITAI